jgi:hypothetical protein
LAGYDIGGDEGYGHQLMDRMQEEGFYLQRFNNGSQPNAPRFTPTWRPNGGHRSPSLSNAAPLSSPTMKSSSPSSPAAANSTTLAAANGSNPKPTCEAAASSRLTAPMP